MHTEFSINSSSFNPGDQIQIKLGTNNTQSRHSIDCFKFKLCRKVTFTVIGKKIETCEYLNYDKIPGCKKFETVQKDFVCNIPKFEPDGVTQLVGSG